jgi:hypothetical protein
MGLGDACQVGQQAAGAPDNDHLRRRRRRRGGGGGVSPRFVTRVHCDATGVAQYTAAFGTQHAHTKLTHTRVHTQVCSKRNGHGRRGHTTTQPHTPTNTTHLVVSKRAPDLPRVAQAQEHCRQPKHPDGHCYQQGEVGLVCGQGRQAWEWRGTGTGASGGGRTSERKRKA